MSEISIQTKIIPCAELGGSSRLPKFSFQQPGKPQLAAPVGLNANECENIVDLGALSMLPYMEQNEYNRKQDFRELKSIVLENDHLRATILPDLGGRLYALYDKAGKRELLFTNPVFQPANLSLRNAWFSGGIEWNGGSIPGHAASTCSPVFCHGVETQRGPILRIHDFDRISETAWQVDLFLPEHESRLYVHGRIINPNSSVRKTYWWTNATVPVTPGLRVVSPADYAIEHAPEDGHLERFEFPDNWGFDGSFPENWHRATSVFFRRENQSLPWIAALNQNGTGLGQISTANLRGRKYFYFGNGEGGTHWMDFLSKPDKGQYIEIQAGIMPTQNQQISMSGKEEIHWSECYFPFSHHIGNDLKFEQAVQKSAAIFERELPGSNFLETDAWLRQMASLQPQKTFGHGPAWGHLHEQILGAPIANGLNFLSPVDVENPWQDLEKNQHFSKTSLQKVPCEFVVSDAWKSQIEKSAAAHGSTWLHHLSLGIIAFDQNKVLSATEHFEFSNNLRENWLAWRCLGLLADLEKKANLAISCYQSALSFSDAPAELNVEFAQLLQQLGQNDLLDAFVDSLPEILDNLERIRLLKAQRALSLKRYDLVEELLEYDFATIREGELVLSEIWDGLVLGRATILVGRQLGEDEMSAARLAAPIPKRLNFVMSENVDISRTKG